MEELRQHALTVAARILRRPEEAEDVAQEAMLRVLRARLNGVPIAAQQAFVTRVAMRLAIDRLRVQRTRRAAVSRLAQRQPIESAPVPPPEIDALYAAIAALPPRQAAVITLRKLFELEYDVVAELLGISVENCRSHCRLGLQSLRMRLGSIAPGPGEPS